MRTILNISFVFFLVWIYSCSHDSKIHSDNSKANYTYGGCLKLSLTDNPGSLFPLKGVDINSNDVVSQIHEGLVRFSPSTLEIIPAIAERWDISNDGKLYTFHLRKDVFFHDNNCFENGKGRNIKATDVEFTFYTACTYNKNNLVFSNTFQNRLKGANEYYEASKKEKFSLQIPGIKVIDDYTISLELIKPDYHFLNILTTFATSIIPQEAFKKYGFDSYVGAGPFMLASKLELKNEFLLLKNKNYYRTDTLGHKLPFLDSVIFTVNTSKRYEMEEFKKQNLDLIWGVPTEMVKAQVEGNIKQFQNDSIYSLKRVPEYTTQFYIFNLNKPIFQNEKVRRAIHLAIDKSKIVDEVLKGEAYSSGTYGITPPSMKDYNVSALKGVNFDPELAKKLLAEAGYPDGKNFPEIKLKINNDGRKNIPVAVEIAKQLERNLKIRLSMDIVSLSDKIEDEYQGKSDMYRAAWTADFPSPESFLNLFYGIHVPKSKSEISFPNTSRFKDTEFDNMFEMALSTKEKNERFKLLLKAEQILINKNPFIPIYYEENYAMIQSYVHDFYFNALKYKDLSCVFINP